MLKRNLFKIFMIALCIVVIAVIVVAFVLPESLRKELGERIGFSSDKLLKAKRTYEEFKMKLGSLAAEKPSIAIYKSQRKLVLKFANQEVYSTRIALGLAPSGHKQKEGDGRTPEGDYYICTRNERSDYHLFLGISYPNAKDATEGLRTGLISQDECDKIVYTTSYQLAPPWKTRLGGAIGIHGGGTSRDWTAGCIAINNEEIEILWGCCPIGTPVRIFP